MHRLTGKRWIRVALAAFLLPWCLSLCATPAVEQPGTAEVATAEAHQGCHSQAPEPVEATEDCSHCEEADDWASGFVFAPLAVFYTPDLTPWPRQAQPLAFHYHLRGPPFHSPPLYLVHEVFLI